jgi:hypothetical protein
MALVQTHAVSEISHSSKIDTSIAHCHAVFLMNPNNDNIIASKSNIKKLRAFTSFATCFQRPKQEVVRRYRQCRAAQCAVSDHHRTVSAELRSAQFLMTTVPSVQSCAVRTFWWPPYRQCRAAQCALSDDHRTVSAELRSAQFLMTTVPSVQSCAVRSFWRPPNCMSARTEVDLQYE